MILLLALLLSGCAADIPQTTRLGPVDLMSLTCLPPGWLFIPWLDGDFIKAICVAVRPC